MFPPTNLPYPAAGFLPSLPGVPHIGADGYAKNLTTNNYLNGVLHNTHQTQDLVYAIGLQESLAIANGAGGLGGVMGGGAAYNPNLAFLQNVVNPSVMQANAIYNQAMARPGQQGMPGAAQPGSTRNSAAADFFGFTGLGAIGGGLAIAGGAAAATALPVGLAIGLAAFILKRLFM